MTPPNFSQAMHAYECIKACVEEIVAYEKCIGHVADMQTTLAPVDHWTTVDRPIPWTIGVTLGPQGAPQEWRITYERNSNDPFGSGDRIRVDSVPVHTRAEISFGATLGAYDINSWIISLLLNVDVIPATSRKELRDAARRGEDLAILQFNLGLPVCTSRGILDDEFFDRDPELVWAEIVDAANLPSKFSAYTRALGVPTEVADAFDDAYYDTSVSIMEPLVAAAHARLAEAV